MPSHLSAIGFCVNNDEELVALAQRLGPLATAYRTPAGTYWQWSAENGAQLWLQTNPENELVGLTPYFGGKAELLVRLTERLPASSGQGLDGSFHGWAAPSDGEAQEGLYPLIFDAPDFDRYAQLPLPCVVPVRIAAFAHELELYDTLEEFQARPQESPRLSDQSFVATGLATEADEVTTAYALLSGHIRAAALLENPQTAEPFWWALVDSEGGSFDVVIDPHFCQSRQPQAGGILAGSFWLCGRLLASNRAVTKTDHKKPGWLARLFGRR